MKNKRTLKMVQMAILIAVLLVMSYTPLGYLKIGLLSISLLSIPVVIGAMLVGPAAGAVLGLYSVLQALPSALEQMLLARRFSALIHF